MSQNNISELRPSATAPPNTPDGVSRQVKRHHSRRSKAQRAEKSLRRFQLLSVVLGGLVVIVGLSFGMTLQPLHAERDELRREVLRLERDLTLANERIAKLSAERDELVATRIPGLKKLVYDETVDVGQKYLRNILFTLTVQEGHPAYEYRVVLSNEELNDIVPEVSVLLFDELGIQLGAARISLDTLASDTGSFKLAPGDVRTYSGRIELTDAGAPVYYVLQVD